MIIAGFGLRAMTSKAGLSAALAATGVSGLTAIAAPADKADHPALTSLATALDLPLMAVPLGLLPAQATRSKSARQPARYGSGSVCEAAALAACGPGARLIRHKQISPCGTATIAIAEGPLP